VSGSPHNSTSRRKMLGALYMMMDIDAERNQNLD